MKMNILILILASILYGCSTTYTVLEPSSRNPFTKAQFTDQILDKEVTVVFANGNEADATLFQVGGDSCVWRDPIKGLSHQVRTQDIKKVVDRNHSLGSLEGFGIGMLGGGIVGGLLGRAIEGPPRGEFGGLGTALAWLAGSIIGGVAGTCYGASSGHKYQYEFVWFSHKSTLKAGMTVQPKENATKE